MRRNRNIYPVMPIFRRDRSGGGGGMIELPYDELTTQIAPTDEYASNGTRLGDCPLGIFDFYTQETLGNNIIRPAYNTSVLKLLYVFKSGAGVQTLEFRQLLSGLCLCKDPNTESTYLMCAVICCQVRIPEYGNTYERLEFENYSKIIETNDIVYMINHINQNKTPYTFMTGKIPICENSNWYYNNTVKMERINQTPESTGGMYINRYTYDRESVRVGNVKIFDPNNIFIDCIQSLINVDFSAYLLKSDVFKTNDDGTISNSEKYPFFPVSYLQYYYMWPLYRETLDNGYFYESL